MSELSKKLIKWHKKSGRKDLPWQIQTNPYKVWISEVMLQQTQVQTVIPYYLRFLDRFPDINSLAESNENEVLSYWSGLGYYSRGRNLLKSAKILQNDFNSIIKTLKDSGIPDSILSSPLTIVSYALVLPDTSSDLTVNISCRV